PSSDGSPLLEEVEEVLAVLVLLHRVGERLELLPVDVAHPEGDLLHAGDLEALTSLHDLDEAGRALERLVGSGIEPGETPTEHLDVELAGLEIGAIDIGDLQLTARGRTEAGGDVQHAVVVEVEAGDRVAGSGTCRLFLDGACAVVRPELYDAVPFRVTD